MNQSMKADGSVLLLSGALRFVQDQFAAGDVGADLRLKELAAEKEAAMLKKAGSKK